MAAQPTSGAPDEESMRGGLVGFRQQQPQRETDPTRIYDPPPRYGFNGPKRNDSEYMFYQAFKLAKTRWHDIWAGILFLLVLGGFIAVSVLSIRGYLTGSRGDGIYGGANDFSLNNNTIIMFALVLAAASVLSWAYITLAFLLPEKIIYITGILNVVWALGTSVYYLYKEYWSAGVVFAVFGLFALLAFLSWVHRIPFSALMLKTTIRVSREFGHVYLVSFIGGFFAVALSAWYTVTLTAIYVTYEPSENNPKCKANGSVCSMAKVIGQAVFITFAMYWISEWLKNTIHTIIAGVYGSWYFCANTPPHKTTRTSARRALTYSFGSISFGSLLLAFIQFSRHICSVAQRNAGQEDGFIGALGQGLFCILGCLISLLEWAVQYVNKYAFCHIALYGKAYIPAAKDTFHMLKDRGVDALVNDCLIAPVLTFGSMFVGFATTLLAYLYLLITNPLYNKDGGFTPVIMAVTWLISTQICLIFTTPIVSGVDTIFVASAWDPQVMIDDHGVIYEEMVRVYPRVQEAIRVR